MLSPFVLVLLLLLSPTKLLKLELYRRVGGCFVRKPSTMFEDPLLSLGVVRHIVAAFRRGDCLRWR